MRTIPLPRGATLDVTRRRMFGLPDVGFSGYPELGGGDEIENVKNVKNEENVMNVETRNPRFYPKRDLLQESSGKVPFFTSSQNDI